MAEDPFSPAQLEAGRKLFAGQIDFVKGVVALDGLPPADRLEIAFAGRSNVGKSSLINALTGRKNIARTSNTPGRTQELNFFDLGGSSDPLGGLMVVDLPGYGYAKVPIEKVEAWVRLLTAYLAGRPNLRRVVVLVDSRHGIKQVDAEIMDLLDQSAVPYQIVLTKADKPKKGELDKVIAETEQALRKRVAAHPVIHVTSSEKGIGLQALRADLALLRNS